MTTGAELRVCAGKGALGYGPVTMPLHGTLFMGGYSGALAARVRACKRHGPRTVRCMVHCSCGRGNDVLDV